MSSMNKICNTLLWIFTVTALLPAGLMAQQESGNQQAASRYILPGERNTILMEINLWGEVKQPGIYKVPGDIDLVSLLSSAGGPTDMAKMREVRVIRAYPQEGDPRVMEVDLRRFIETADASQLPNLYPGDTVYVPGNFRRYFSTSLGIAGSVAGIASAVALIYERMVRAASYR